MNKNLSIFLSVGVAVAIFSGCGGSNGTAIEKNIGYYKGSSIVGVDYLCGEKRGKTLAGGKFEFESGKGCTFSIGDLELKKVKPSELKDGVKIVEKNPKVIALLMTIDKDSDEELKVTSDAIEALKKENIKKISDISDSNLELIADDLKVEVAREDDAIKHIEDSKNKNNSDLKTLLAGKTFYAVDNSKEDGITNVTFNENATEMTLVENGEEHTSAIKIEGNKISIVGESEYGMFVKKTNDYILFNDFDEDGKADGQSRFYYTETKAQEYIDQPISGGSGGNNGSGS
jgi:hypothetical protein